MTWARDYDYDDSEADELRAEARRQRALSRGCPECAGTMGAHVAGCPEDEDFEEDDNEAEESPADRCVNLTLAGAAVFLAVLLVAERMA